MLRVSPIYSDYMVLQQNSTVAIWGTVEAGDCVSVVFEDTSLELKADEHGFWMGHLMTGPASFTPRKLKVTCQEQSVTFKDVLIGEVWLCAGQSNMQLPVKEALDSDIELLAANHPMLRLYNCPENAAVEPVFTQDASWSVCTQETIAEFSAVAYFFGRDVQQVLQVPVGLINASVGGSPLVAWTRQAVIEQNRNLHPYIEEKREQFKPDQRGENTIIPTQYPSALVSR